MQETVFIILWGKCKEIIKNSSLRDIFKGFLYIFIIITLTGMLTYPKELAIILEYILSLYNFIIPKFIASNLILLNIHKIIDSFKKIDFNFSQKNIDTIEGIPTYELIDYLFNNKTFKRVEVMTTFNLPKNRFENLAKKLDDLKITIRGENNSRILNQEYTRQELVLILAGKQKSKDIQPLVQEISESNFVIGPIKKQLIFEKQKDEDFKKRQKIDLSPLELEIRKIPILLK